MRPLRRKVCTASTAAGALTAVLFFSLGCDDRYAAEREYLRQPPAEQHRGFEKLSPEKQVRVYIAAQIADPPDLTFCEELRKRWEAALPTVLGALANERGERLEDREKRALIGALECIATRQRAPCDPRLSPIANAAAKSIFDKSVRDDAVRAANELRCGR